MCPGVRPPGAGAVASAGDRAYSNWTHLWFDGLEPIGDFARARAAEDARVAAGRTPFRRYRWLGLYGKRLRCRPR